MRRQGELYQLAVNDLGQHPCTPLIRSEVQRRRLELVTEPNGNRNIRSCRGFGEFLFKRFNVYAVLNYPVS